MNKRVAAVVVTYNRKALLKECIDSLLAQTCRDCLDVVIVDNNSTDGTKEFITPYIDADEIIYLNTGANIGGAGGFNYGVRYAAEHGYEFTWLMDDDCIPHSDALEEFLNWHEKLKGRYGFLSGKAIWTDGSICKMNCHKIGLRECVEDHDKPIVEIIAATFVSFFFQTKMVYKVGLPIKEFFIWCDDLEYSRRVSKVLPGYYIASSVAVHKCAQNIGSDIARDSLERIDRYNYAYRNEVYYFTHQGIEGIGYWLLRLAKHVLKVLILAKDYRLKRLGVIFKATIRGFSFHPQVERVKKPKQSK